MKKHIALLLTAVAILGFTTNQAKAAPVSLTLTLTTDAGMDLLISAAVVLTGSAGFDFTGTIDIVLDDAIDDLAGTNDTTSFEFVGAAIAISDESLVIPSIIDSEFIGVGINTLTSNGPIPLTTSVPVNPFAYTFDPGAGSPTTFGLDVGLLTYSGLASGTFDFGTDPLLGDLGPVGQIGFVTQDVTITGNTIVVDVTVSAPLTFNSNITTDPLPIDVDLSGAIVATGSYTTIIPEPSSIVLLGIALVGMIPVWRRMRK